MKCYYTGEECDCGAELDDECPHDQMEHDDELFDAVEMLETESRFAEISEQLERHARQ